tara:strand:- start:6029 stop:6865 length:837 start_codon:yes stop_codon:yes gene_type:complete
MFNDVIENFSDAINSISQTETYNQLKKADLAIPTCNKAISILQDIVEKADFETTQLEISFFKNVKVIPMSYLIYYSEIRACELQIPKAGKAYQLKFLEKEIRKINKFFSKNSDFVHYMEQGHSYLDHQFFTRNHRNNFPFTPMINYYQYPEFSTSHDMLWAKVQAMYRYIHYIRETIQIVKPGSNQFHNEKKHKLLLWTTSKTALIELIYALSSVSALNHGTADLSTITSSFEDFFNVKLDNVYKTYSEIKARKGNKTKFLEELRIKLQQKINQDDAV